MQTSVAAHHSGVRDDDDRALASMFVAYTVAATFWLPFATAVGVFLAYKFGAPDFATRSASSLRTSEAAPHQDDAIGGKRRAFELAPACLPK